MNGKIIHGHARGKPSSTYRRWSLMKQRCHNPKSGSYKNYGARGITVCARWRESFENFLADMGEAPEGKWLERIDNDGNYCPENCRWATIQEQYENTTRTVFIEYNGKRQAASRWAIELGIPAYVILARKANGDTTAERLLRPYVLQIRNKILTFMGQSRTVTEWASIRGVNRGTIWSRMTRGIINPRLLLMPPSRIPYAQR